MKGGTYWDGEWERAEPCGRLWACAAGSSFLHCRDPGTPAYPSSCSDLQRDGVDHMTAD